jgi:hypothetical protein
VSTHFKPFGPFEISRTDETLAPDALADMWQHANAQRKGLSKGIGVYIIAAGDGKTLTPWYVGKSDTGFKSRLSEKHHAFNVIAESKARGNLYLFLLAKVSTKRGTLSKPLKKKLIDADDDVYKSDEADGLRSRRRSRRSIGKLEFLLIGRCLERNPELVNDKDKSFHAGLVVSGYLNDRNAEPSDTVRSLRIMLARQKSGV